VLNLPGNERRRRPRLAGDAVLTRAGPAHTEPDTSAIPPLNSGTSDRRDDVGRPLSIPVGRAVVGRTLPAMQRLSAGRDRRVWKASQAGHAHPRAVRAIDASLAARQTCRMSSPIRSRTFTTTLEALPKGKARVAVPFDPNEVWGTKQEHHVGGTIAGMSVRETIVSDASGWSFSLGPAWLRDCPVGVGHRVEVIIDPEGPQRSDLAPELAAALEANPVAGEFFDTLAQFTGRASCDGSTRPSAGLSSALSASRKWCASSTRAPRRVPLRHRCTTSLGIEQSSAAHFRRTLAQAVHGIGHPPCERSW
jgi:hypothetical protein